MKKKYIYIIIAVIIVFIMLGIVYVLFGNSNLQNNSVESKIENKMEEFSWIKILSINTTIPNFHNCADNPER